MLATEEPTPSSPNPAPRPQLLEEWAQNDVMRQIPSLSWIVQKLDGDVRRRIEHLLVPYSDIAPSDPRHAAIEAELRLVCRSLERISDCTRRGRGHAPNEAAARVRWTLDQTVHNLNTLDPHTFGRRFPFQTFERSNAEPLWGALLCVIQHLQKIVPLVREIEPDIDERMYEGLVQLNDPLPREPMA